MVNVFNRIIPGDSLSGSSPAKNSCRKSVRVEPSDVPSRARPSLVRHGQTFGLILPFIVRSIV